MRVACTLLCIWVYEVGVMAWLLNKEEEKGEEVRGIKYSNAETTASMLSSFPPHDVIRDRVERRTCYRGEGW